MKTLLALVSVAAVAYGAPAHGIHNSQTLASCSATNPTVGSNLAIDDANGCTASFSVTERREVVTLLDPPEAYAGTLGLRVRGPNALWTNHRAVFAAGQLVAGDEASSFWLEPGTWQLEVYISDMSSDVGSAYQVGVGTFGGRVLG